MLVIAMPHLHNWRHCQNAIENLTCHQMNGKTRILQLKTFVKIVKKIESYNSVCSFNLNILCMCVSRENCNYM